MPRSPRSILLLACAVAALTATACVDFTEVNPAACASRSPNLKGKWAGTLAQHTLTVDITERCLVDVFMGDTVVTMNGRWNWNTMTGLMDVGRLNGGYQLQMDVDSLQNLVLVDIPGAELPARATLNTAVFGSFPKSDAPGQAFTFYNTQLILKRQ